MNKSVMSLMLASTLASPMSAQAELSASVDISNLYLFRGLDMSNGSPAVAGSLDYSHDSGAFAGVWSTSGDDAAGTEVNYYLGYEGSLHDFNYSLSYLNYYYPKSKAAAAPADRVVSFNDYAEVTLGLGYKDLAFSVTAPTSDDFAGQYVYYNLAYSYQQFSAALGVNAHEDSESSYSHLDLGYQFNERLSFVVSQVLDQGSGADFPDATVFQVNFSLPIEL